MTVNPGLPLTPQGFANSTWKEILPFYEELAMRPLSQENVEEWLSDWSRFESLLSEAAAWAAFAFSCDTGDEEASLAHDRFTSEIEPKAAEQMVRLQRRIVELGYVRPGLEEVIKSFKNQMELFRSINVPLESELASLESEWNKLSGKMTVVWDGQEITPDQLVPYLLSPDRAIREKAFKLRATPYLETREEVGKIFNRMYDLRQQIALNAGFANYRDYMHQALERFDYKPSDCVRFHQAVEKVVVPAMKRILEHRRTTMGLANLRPWDTDVDPQSRPALKPFEDSQTLIDRAVGVFGKVDSDFQDYYNQMISHHLLDLSNRKGKAPGGYCQDLNWSGRALIYMNAVGVDEDVRTLMHESGHAFHAFESARLPLIFQRGVGSEIAELASMSMELLTSPFIGKENGGYYSSQDAIRSRITLLEEIIIFLPHCATVDAFQHWMYLNPEGRESEARDQKWLELRKRFWGSSIDWSGLEQERISRWYQQPHFFAYPFYYIEYGIAQLGALQVWRNSQKDYPLAVRKYRQALSLGATKALPELFEAAGARLIFDAEGMGELVDLVEKELNLLYHLEASFSTRENSL